MHYFFYNSFDTRTYFKKERLIKFLRNFIFIISTYIATFCLVFNIFDLQQVEASTLQNNKLIERIAKDYTNKFCNSIAFGLSKDSAMKFSFKENKLIFKNKKGFESLDKQLIAKEIASSVVEDCGYLVDLRGEVGINQFEKDYISMN